MLTAIMSVNELTPFIFSFINSGEQWVNLIKIMSKVYTKSIMDTIIRVEMYVFTFEGVI